MSSIELQIEVAARAGFAHVVSYSLTQKVHWKQQILLFFLFLFLFSSAYFVGTVQTVWKNWLLCSVWRAEEMKWQKNNNNNKKKQSFKLILSEFFKLHCQWSSIFRATSLIVNTETELNAHVLWIALGTLFSNRMTMEPAFLSQRSTVSPPDRHGAHSPLLNGWNVTLKSQVSPSKNVASSPGNLAWKPSKLNYLD